MAREGSAGGGEDGFYRGDDFGAGTGEALDFVGAGTAGLDVRSAVAFQAGIIYHQSHHLGGSNGQCSDVRRVLKRRKHPHLGCEHRIEGAT